MNVKVENTVETPEITDPFRMYLYEISKHPILTKEEEREIAERIYFRNDKEAEQKMVVANLRLVVKIALDYYSYQLNVLDLIQEGNVGLLRAVKKYDPRRGTRFSTYASFWIRAYILKYLMDSWSIVKVGTKDSQRKLFFSLNKEKEKLEKVGITPSAEILAGNLDVSTEDIEDMEKRLYNGDISLEDPVYGGGEEVMDTLSSDEDIEETVAEKEKREILNKRLVEFKKLLSEKERFIFEHRIMAEEPITLREIGERFNTSRESIRQLQARISKNLTKSLRSSPLWS
ncbi:MAG: RNA polymerase sigma factor RpoH [Syntrophorhabdaceae bacterium PtaU1.Bin034]|nr:MAG: RNA polymerase sigma factor RpoH [Syntrophorhabdaceae bacterium PtaU1.Bin034]